MTEREKNGILRVKTNKYILNHCSKWYSSYIFRIMISVGTERCLHLLRESKRQTSCQVWMLEKKGIWKNSIQRFWTRVSLSYWALTPKWLRSFNLSMHVKCKHELRGRAYAFCSFFLRRKSSWDFLILKNIIDFCIKKKKEEMALG